MTDYTKLIERAKDQRDRDAAEHCPAEIIALQDEVIAGLEALQGEVEQVKGFWKEAQLRNRNLLEEGNDLAMLAEQYKAERDALQAKLDALQTQEPVAIVQEVHMSRYTIEWTNGLLPEGTMLYAAPKALEPLTKTEVKDLTAMVFGAPCTDEILEWLPSVIAQYEALIATNKRPVDPADEAAHGITKGTP